MREDRLNGRQAGKAGDGGRVGRCVGGVGAELGSKRRHRGPHTAWWGGHAAGWQNTAERGRRARPLCRWHRLTGGLPLPSALGRGSIRARARVAEVRRQVGHVATRLQLVVMPHQHLHHDARHEVSPHRGALKQGVSIQARLRRELKRAQAGGSGCGMATCWCAAPAGVLRGGNQHRRGPACGALAAAAGKRSHLFRPSAAGVHAP